jgi:hypothetical protein
MDLEVVTERLAAAVAAYGLPDFTALPYVPDSVNPPTGYCADIRIAYEGSEVTYGGDEDVEIIWRVLTSRSDDLSGQALLKRYMARTGPTSVRAALESARGEPGQAALAGACDDYHVRRVQGHRLYTVGDKQYYGAEWIVHVIGDGDS